MSDTDTHPTTTDPHERRVLRVHEDEPLRGFASDNNASVHPDIMAALAAANEAKAVFAILPREVTERLQQRFRFHTWQERTGEVRWMCSFDTTEADVDAFAAAIAQEMAA